MQVGGGRLGRKMKDFKEFDNLMHSHIEREEFSKIFNDNLEQELQEVKNRTGEDNLLQASIKTAFQVASIWPIHVLEKYHEWVNEE